MRQKHFCSAWNRLPPGCAAAVWSVHGPQACQGVTAGLDENGFLRVETAAGLVTVQTGGLRAAEKD